MFEFFLNDYYEKVYKEANRKLKYYECIMLIFLILSTLFTIYSLIFKYGQTMFYIALILEIATMLVIYIYTKIRNKRDSKNLVKKYKKKRINALIEFMKSWGNNSEDDSKNDLYNIFGVEWALACTKNKLEKNHSIQELQDMGQDFYMYIFPLVTLCVGALIEKSTSEQIISFASSIISFAIIVISAITAIKIFINWILTPKRFALEILRDDLEYIKVILQSKNRIHKFLINNNSKIIQFYFTR